MLALELWRRSRCSRCGHNLVKSTDPATEDRYVAKLPTQCHACLALSQSEEKYRDEPHPHTLIHQVELRR